MRIKNDKLLASFLKKKQVAYFIFQFIEKKGEGCSMRINGHSFFLWCMVMIEKRHSALNEKPIKQKRIHAENIKGDDKGELDKKCIFRDGL